MKLRKLLSLVLAAVMLLGCMTVTAFAQETKQLTVNDGTLVNNRVPFCATLCDCCPMQTQFIQPANSLSAMKDGTITQTTFYLFQYEQNETATFEVRLMETDATSFTDDFLNTDDATLVYTGAVEPNSNSQIVIPFTNPYEYKGGNLLIDFTLKTNGTEKNISFYGIVAENACRQKNAYSVAVENGSFLPKMTFDYEVPTYLDLDGTDATYSDKKDIEQNYTFTQASEEYTDVTKVKLEWTIKDIAATYTSNKTWDPDTLTWKETKTVADIADHTATFKLTNYSSKAVKANVAFAVEDSLSATYDAENSSFTNNDCTVETPVKQDDTTTYQDSDFTALAQTITATLKFNKDEFAELSEATEATKYGTYTITISEVPTVTWKPLSATVQGSTVYYFPVLGGTNPQPDKFAYSTDGVTFTEIEKPDGGYTMTGDVATYAKAGQLYYQGGSVNTVRTVNKMAYENVWSSCADGVCASCAYDDLKDGIKAKITTDGSDIVEKVTIEETGDPSSTPLIKGISLGVIYQAYNNGENGFGGTGRKFWSCLGDGSMTAWYYGYDYYSPWSAKLTSANDACVLISHIFS